MYYEICDELVSARSTLKPLSPLALVNKSYIDCFYDLRSQIQPIYLTEIDQKRLLEGNYPYLYSQKIINGIAKAIFLGLDVFSLSGDLFYPSGRMRVPEQSLSFSLGDPCLYVNSAATISYQETSLQRWEDEFMKIAPALEQLLGIKVSREGFKAQLYRILEILYGYRHEGSRRSGWCSFLQELIVHHKEFSMDDLRTKYTLEKVGSGLRLTDPAFVTRDYLEYAHNSSLGNLRTSDIKLPELVQDPKLAYSQINQALIRKIPLCHFGIGELMFVSKEEYLLNQYYEWYIKPWTSSRSVTIHYLDNHQKIQKSSELGPFAQELKDMKYALVYGFSVLEDTGEFFYSAEPKMLKD